MTKDETSEALVPVATAEEEVSIVAEDLKGFFSPQDMSYFTG